MRIVVAGAVSTTRLTLEALLRHGATVVGILELREESSHTVTGFESLSSVAQGVGVPCVTFRNINDSDVVEQVRSWQPDVIFVVGLSQLVRPELLSLPTMGTIGFHPTLLPAGRGRAPLAWLTLDGRPGAATFFLMDEGVDAGPIFVQEPFTVGSDDYASNVAAKLETATVVALNRWLPEFLSGVWNPRPQDEVLASWNGRRAPEDGLIDWHTPAAEIYALIRAASRPHPGAYTWHGDRRVIIWRAELETRLPWRGVPGRILLTDPDRGVLIQTGEGLLWLTEIETLSATHTRNKQSGAIPDANDWLTSLRVGVRLGYASQDEIAELRSRVAALEVMVEKLATQSDRSIEHSL